MSNWKYLLFWRVCSATPNIPGSIGTEMKNDRLSVNSLCSAFSLFKFPSRRESLDEDWLRMVLVCFVLDLRNISPYLIGDLKQVSLSLKYICWSNLILVFVYEARNRMFLQTLSLEFANFVVVSESRQSTRRFVSGRFSRWSDWFVLYPEGSDIWKRSGYTHRSSFSSNFRWLCVVFVYVSMDLAVEICVHSQWKLLPSGLPSRC